MRKFFKFIRNLLISVFIFISLVFAVGFYYSYPLKKYCEALEIGSAFTEAVALGKDKGFYTSADDSAKDGTMFIHNHMSPFFRIGCVIELESGKISKKKVMGTD